MFSKTFEITKRASLLAAAVTLTALLGAQSAQAQEFPASEQNQKIQKKVSVERTYSAPIPLTDEVKKQMKPGIRYLIIANFFRLIRGPSAYPSDETQIVQ